MDITEFDLRNFLTFNVRKGLETGDYDGLVSIRTSTIDNVIHSDKPLLVTANGQEGIMILTPGIILSRIIAQTDKVYGTSPNKYGLARIPWRPTDEGTLKSLNKLYKIHRDLTEDIDSIIQELEKKIVQES